MRNALLVCFGTLASPLFAKDVPWSVIQEKEGKPPAAGVEVEEPWFTGPLISPSGHVVPGGHINFEPYVYATAITGHYNSRWHKVETPTIWNVTFQNPLQIGVTRWMDLQFVPTWDANFAAGAANFVLADLPVSAEFQLLTDSETNYYPALKLALRSTLPTGPYDDLDPNQNGTDAGGGGAYVIGFGLVASRLIHISGVYWSNIRLAYRYSFPTKVHVNGYNAYGGAVGTDGWVYPAQSYEFDLGMEFSVSRRWTIALDAVAVYSGETRFKGKPGYTDTGEPAMTNTGSSAQYSLAPALEYNWNASLGIISGAWFTVAGRNAQIFTSWVTALNYFY